MILGSKKIPQSLQKKLNLAGISHIIAISGMHIVVISNLLLALFSAFRFRRAKAAGLALIFIGLFIALTGFSASAVRAGLMGSLFLLAPVLGRSSDSLRSILLAGLIMAAFNPFLIYDIGFQLSFLASLGIIFLNGFFLRKLAFVSNKFLTREILSSTASAYVFTLPILIYNFGQVSISGPLANILVLPVIAPAMVLGFLAATVSLISSLAGQILFYLPFILLNYLILVADILSEAWMSFKTGGLHWSWPVFLYLAIIPAGYYFFKREKACPKFLK